MEASATKDVTQIEIDGQPVNIQPEIVPRFSFNDPEFVEYFYNNGYVVIQGVLSHQEIEDSECRLWDYLEKNADMKRDDTSTWTLSNLEKIGIATNGILRNTIGQSDFLWQLRLNPKLQQAFKNLLKTDDLITSMDGGNIFLPWHAEGLHEARTSSGWFHVDQGSLKRGFHCVQGIVTLLDCNEHTGGFSLIPHSADDHDELMDLTKIDKDFVTVPPTFQSLQKKQILPCYQAGDMILWDSRTIHASTPALAHPISPPNKLLREIAYITMSPREWASEEVIENRVRAYERDFSLYHWPHVITHEIPDSFTKVRSIDDAPEEVRKLIGCRL